MLVSGVVMVGLWGWVLSLGLGMSLGLVGGMLGIGGGLIAIPLLALLYGMDQALAQGTALVMIVPNVLIGFVRYRQRHPVRSSSLLSMLLPAVLAAHFAARLATSIDPVFLRHTFVVFLLVLTGFMLWSGTERAGMPRRLSWPHVWLPVVGLASGFMSGMFTIGGGLVVVPALVMLFGIAQTTAQGMALAMVVPGALVALLGYAQSGHVDWAVGLPMAFGGVLTVSKGVALAHATRPQTLRWAFCAVLLGTAVAMAV